MQSGRAKILVVDDDHDVASSVREYIEEQFLCDVAHTATEGLALALTGKYDLAILDVHLPDMSGFEICKNIRAKGLSLPLLFLTGKFDTTADTITGLEIGADEYLIKPIHPKELMARIRSFLRRHTPVDEGGRFSFADIVVDTLQRKVIRSDQEIPLRRKEFDLLLYFLQNPQRVITRGMILDHVWGGESDSLNNIVDVHIKYLRDKVDKPFSRKIIKTVHGVGYMMA